jgi:predicted cupin superfamily sugar epimerase
MTDKATATARSPSPAELIATLGLTPGSCGFMATSYRSVLEVTPNGAAQRPIGEALYFLVTLAAGVQLHRIRSDQLYHHYLGDPLEVLLLPEDGPASTAVVGSDFASGQRPQLLVRGGTFHAARVLPGGTSALLGTTSWPALAEGELEMGDAGALAARYPEVADTLADFPSVN